MKLKTATIINRYIQLQIEESKEPQKQMWCSMADASQPKGSQFLGAVVVEARGVATATHELNQRRLNLGGEILFVEIPADRRIPDEWMYRVMDKQESLNCPVVQK